MTAAELIDLLKRHPKACERIGVERDRDLVLCDCCRWECINDKSPRVRDVLRRWLLGACVEWCDEHGIEVLKSSLQRGVSQYVICRHFVTEDTPYKSRLHACLAAIEETT